MSTISTTDFLHLENGHHRYQKWFAEFIDWRDVIHSIVRFQWKKIKRTMQRAPIEVFINNSIKIECEWLFVSFLIASRTLSVFIGIIHLAAALHRIFWNNICWVEVSLCALNKKTFAILVLPCSRKKMHCYTVLCEWTENVPKTTIFFSLLCLMFVWVEARANAFSLYSRQIVNVFYWF